MIHFVCFKWSKPGYRSKFDYKHVNILRRMLLRNCSYEHRLVCVTDDKKGIAPEVITVKLWDDHASMLNASWATGPSCYRRLKVFTQEFADMIGATQTDLIVCIDLDMVIVSTIDSLITKLMCAPVIIDLIMWGTGEERIPVCGSLFGFRADGSLSYIWKQFTAAPINVAREASKHMPGSDQSVMAYLVGLDNIGRWSQRDGLYSMGTDLCYGVVYSKLHSLGARIKPPHNASIVVFNGKPDPWECLALPWVKANYK